MHEAVVISCWDQFLLKIQCLSLIIPASFLMGDPLMDPRH